MEFAVIGAGLGLGLESPIDGRNRIQHVPANADNVTAWCGAEDRLADFHIRSCLDDGDTESRLGQPCTYGIATSASTDNDIVKVFVRAKVAFEFAQRSLLQAISGRC